MMLLSPYWLSCLMHRKTRPVRRSKARRRLHERQANHGRIALSVEELETRTAPAIAYAFTYAGYPSPEQLVRIDTATGKQSALLQQPYNATFYPALGVQPNGNLVCYGSLSGRPPSVYEIDPTAATPTPSLIASVPFVYNTYLTDLAVGPDGTVFLAFGGATGGSSGASTFPAQPGYIAAVDPANGQVTTVWQGAGGTDDGPTGLTNFWANYYGQGLVVEPDGTLVFVGTVGGQAGIYEIHEPLSENATPGLLAPAPTPPGTWDQYQAYTVNPGAPLNYVTALAIGVQGEIYATVCADDGVPGPGELLQIDPVTGQESIVWQGKSGTGDGPNGAGFSVENPDGSTSSIPAGFGLAVEPGPHGKVLFTGSINNQYGLYEFDPKSLAAPTLAVSLVVNTPIQAMVDPLLGYTPAQIRTMYGIDKLPASADGSGQTIAIVVAYDDPNLIQDVDTFDQEFGTTFFGSTLYDQYGVASSFLTVLNQDGHAGPLPGTDPAGPDPGGANWEGEESMDVEWAHAIAPGAKIDVIECNSGDDLDPAAAVAATLPGVSVVSMSFGGAEDAEDNGDLAENHYFTTPAGHVGVTFLAASGDHGTADAGYPAFSPYVVAVGGTSLYTNEDSTYASETGWSGSGGGGSTVEPEPAYQSDVQATHYRTIPDVAFEADPSTGTAQCDSYNQPATHQWEIGNGTSLATPCWAGLIAIVNQGRAAAHQALLNSSSFYPTETLAALYSLPGSDFHKNLGGNNGTTYSNPGVYDLVTGLGSPIADRLVPDLIAYNGGDTLDINVNPVNITQGVPLNNLQLGGTVLFNGQSVAGTFTYSSAAGTVLEVGDGQTEDVTFTPDDLADYTAVTTSVTVDVSPPSGTTIFFFTQPSARVSAGSSFSAVVEAVDGNGNAVGGLPITLGISAGSLTGKTNVNTNASGQATFSLSDTMAGTYSLIASVPGVPSVFSTSLTISAGPMAGFGISVPGPTFAGAAFGVTVTSVDQYENPITSYHGVATLSSSDGQRVSPATVTLTHGTGSAMLTLNTPATLTLSATAGTITRTLSSPSITVLPALTWTGAAKDPTHAWSNAKNWQGDKAPANGDVLLFPRGAPLHSTDDLPGLQLLAIDIEAAGYDFTAGAGVQLDLTGSLVNNTGSDTYAIPTTLDGPVSFDIGGTLTVDTTLSDGATPGRLSILGGGNLVLTQANSYTGGTVVQRATVSIRSATALGTQTLALDTGAILQNAIAPHASLTLANPVSFQGAVNVSVGGGLAFSGAISVAAAGSTLTVQGATGHGGLGTGDATGHLLFDRSGDLAGPGTLTFAGSRASTANVELACAVNAKLVAASGSALFLDGTLGANAVIDVLSKATATLAGVNGSGAIAVNGGTILAARANASLTATLTLTSGIINVSATDGLGTGTLQLAGGLLMDTSKNTLTLENPLLVAAITNVSATHGTLAFNENVAVSGVSVLTLTAVSQIDFGGAFSGQNKDSKLTVNGTGTVTITVGSSLLTFGPKVRHN
jgi:autotransporter-associated beta strand protein